MGGRMRKGVLILLALILLLGLGCAYFLYRYNLAIDESAGRWYEKEYLGKRIEGVLASITEFEGNPYKVVIGIRNKGDEFELSYGNTCLDEEFYSFVGVGDSVFKAKNEKALRFCKQNGQCKAFELNFCGRFE
jgi:hypothetical protein